ncbi:cytochrome c oxidase subunit II [Calditrichota bacterium]
MIDTTGTFWMPQAASTVAGETDALFYFLLWLSVFFFVLIVTLMVAFAFKFRQKGATPEPTHGEAHNNLLEWIWVVVPTIIVIIIFVWGAKGFMKMAVVPAGAMEVKVTGQKWFWSFDYPEGASTINELVVPVDKPVKLLMSSQDVIHSFFVPEFRVKRDVLPNRYQVTWFEATQVGEYRLYCAEYCGSKHSAMLGTVRVVSDREYNEWLEDAAFSGEGMTPEDYGAKLYLSKACNTCHTVDGAAGNGPSFLGVFGHDVKLASGETVTADENYIRKSILTPAADVVAGFTPIMPTYQGLLKDRDIDALIAFIKSLGGGEH